MPQSVIRDPSHKIAHVPFKSVQLGDLPGTAILLDALRPLEQELHRRDLLGPQAKTSHPLWFLGEMERNVFLWRHGMSLSDQESFEFWIDIPALIQRRERQFEHAVEDTGFGNPFLGGLDASPKERAGETEYLNHIQSVFGRIYAHAFELSLIARTLQHEVLKHDRPIILLPRSRAVKPPAP